MTRLHALTAEALARKDGDTWVLRSPAPGWFYPSLTEGDLVIAKHAIGELEVLGRRTLIVAPDVRGIASAPPALFAPRAVGFGDPLVVIDTAAQLAAIGASADLPLADATIGLVFRAPTSGRFYGRAAPGKPAFISVGDELHPGATVCLLEVMKTFHRVTYGGAGLPERARVREVLVADGADVTSGDPLLALE